MRYLLQKSETDPLWWILTDTDENISCRFKEGEFNETQQFTPLNDISEYDMESLPAIVKDMADWLRQNHYEIIFTSPQATAAKSRKDIGRQIRELRESEDIGLSHLSKITGIKENRLNRIEEGKYNVDTDTLSIIAEALGKRLSLTDKSEE